MTVKDVPELAFSHKHYEVIAKVIRGIVSLSPGDRQIIVGHFGRALARNPKFDYLRFRKACGLEE